jgi:peptidoglycan-associated lipoprotein
MSRSRLITTWFVAAALAGSMACAGKKPPVAKPTPPPPAPVLDNTPVAPPTRPPAPPQPVTEPPMVPMEPLAADDISKKDLDAINKEGLLKPVFFALDSDQIDAAAQQIIIENAQLLRKQATWVITIEGHCDERGTPEYNLALGERRALSTKTYLLSLGISADRVKTVSYGKEFPFDPGHDEAAMIKNRRAHFVVTAK